MTTDKDPDFAAIARNLAADKYPRSLKSPVEIMGADEEVLLNEVEQNCNREGYASCMEARLRSDWETIRLLRNEQRLLEAQELTLTDALKAHLSKLLEPFTTWATGKEE